MPEPGVAIVSVSTPVAARIVSSSRYCADASRPASETIIIEHATISFAIRDTTSSPYERLMRILLREV